MRITTILITVVAWAARQGAAGQTADQKVIVCRIGPIGFGVPVAETESAKIFARIGVAIEWYSSHRACREEGIVISLNQDTPDNLHPGALAYARPYEGTHIEVFYDRIRQTVKPGTELHLLAYVFVHEIAHILQGINRHSDFGIMKARWGDDDYFQMRRGSLAFTPTDVNLILAGLRAAKSKHLVSNLGSRR